VCVCVCVRKMIEWGWGIVVKRIAISESDRGKERACVCVKTIEGGLKRGRNREDL
jgi:hypothetical protein